MRQRTRPVQSQVRAAMRAPLTGPFLTTVPAARHWFKALNHEVFRDDLTPARIRVLREIGRWASYEPDDHRINLAPKFFTQQQFIAVLAHEMVHHWCELYHPDDGACHGRRFFEWRERFLKFGMVLSISGDVHIKE